MPSGYVLHPLIYFMHEKERSLKELEEICSFKDIQDLVYEGLVEKIIDKSGEAKLRYDLDIPTFLEKYDSLQELFMARKEGNIEGEVVVCDVIGKTKEGRRIYQMTDKYGGFGKYMKK